MVVYYSEHTLPRLDRDVVTNYGLTAESQSAQSRLLYDFFTLA